MENYYGRLFTQNQVPEELREKAIKLESVSQKGQTRICNRCASLISKENQLPTKAYYCRECLVFGRLVSNESLYHFPQSPFPKITSLKWSGQLTPYQEEVSQGLLKGIAEKENLLVHAVTGAGKTEMIYQSVAKVLDDGGCVCIASPRIDVCLELYRRLSQDFSCPITLMHGDSAPYQRAPLIIATTHQLLKFYQAFDLLIIDEVDAFPYVDNLMLYHAVDQSVKIDGVKIFLTATSTDELDRKVRNKSLKKRHLARRFHAKPLVIPKMIWLSKISEKLAKGNLPAKLKGEIIKQRQTGFPLLIFFPNIVRGQQFAKILQTHFPKEKIAFVSSQTENRLDLVEQFRNQELTILVTTTILERGVTFPCVDVFVIEANHRLYTRSSLVQIAGRVGRSPQRPTGLLNFYHDGISKAMLQSKAEIKEMNQKGGFA